MTNCLTIELVREDQSVETLYADISESSRDLCFRSFDLLRGFEEFDVLEFAIDIVELNPDTTFADVRVQTEDGVWVRFVPATQDSWNDLKDNASMDIPLIEKLFALFATEEGFVSVRTKELLRFVDALLSSEPLPERIGEIANAYRAFANTLDDDHPFSDCFPRSSSFIE